MCVCQLLLCSLGGSDYTTVMRVPLVFSATVTSQCRDINITNDSLYEMDETFSLVMTSSEPDVSFVRNVTTLTLQDNEG